MRRLILGLILLFTFVRPLSAAVLIEENGKAVRKSSVKVAQSGMALRELRKVAVGMGLAGVHGLFGFNLELNFLPEIGLGGGFGLGKGFQTFHFQVKKVIPGRWFLPYVAGGYTYWYVVRDEEAEIEESNPPFLAKKFLGEKEKRTGQFAEHILYPALGIQYMQLKGAYAGLSLYAEVLMMIDLDDLVTSPTGGLGMMYYF